MTEQPQPNVDSTDLTVFSEMRSTLKTQFDKMVDDPINLNNMFEHLAALTSAVDTLIQVSQQMYELASETNEG